MREWQCAGLTGAVVLLLFYGLPQPSAAAQSDAAPPAGARTARVALISNFPARCPELKRAEPGEESVAIVVFQVGVSGLPSHASISSSSHSDSLDAAAASCVMQLRFQPATSPGSGDAVVSWQQLALRWLRPSAHSADQSPRPTGASLPAAAPASAVAVDDPRPPATQPADVRVDVRVCVDRSGKLARQPSVVRASGDAQFDAAAVKIAESASGSYPSASSLDTASTSECRPLTLSIEQR
jgi:TonB family protein